MRRQGGSASVEFVWVTLILLVPFVYLLLAVFETQRAAYGVSVAGKAAARAYLLAPDLTTAEQRARLAADVALADHDVQADVAIRCHPTPADCLQPGSSVLVTVRAVQPLPLTPSALGDQLGGISVDSEHREPYGTFREGR
ncbi:TadE/TadG family type IV pilus assembly protein [Aeromicrobium sp. CF4.19]|uniref:TadE/TadG family type IV pilus assembly protein n=1 Tax=Aeromicrobium sp. CF4.19 TaxID=3373082 RepID=UPI003EE47A03